jgi:hypothetical protein
MIDSRCFDQRVSSKVREYTRRCLVQKCVRRTKTVRVPLENKCDEVGLPEVMYLIRMSRFERENKKCNLRGHNSALLSPLSVSDDNGTVFSTLL